MKMLVIPDIHLKPDIVDRATGIMHELIKLENKLPESDRKTIGAVFLGDVADDFGKQNELALYEETYDAVIGFLATFKESYFCVGNHDISYVWEMEESGYSLNEKVQDVVRKKMTTLEKLLGKKRFAFIHCIDNVIFSHAGLSKPYYYRYGSACPDINSLISRINTFGVSELWVDASPIWARIQSGWFQNFAPLICDKLQVVGHTPLEEVLFEENMNLLSVDVFSTQPNGKPIGKKEDQRFVVVDTVKKTFGYADEIVSCIPYGDRC